MQQCLIEILIREMKFCTLTDTDTDTYVYTFIYRFLKEYTLFLSLMQSD